MIYHRSNMNYFDEELKKNINFKHDRNFIEEKYLKFNNITKFCSFLNNREKNVRKTFESIAL